MWAKDVWAGKKRRPVAPRATQRKAESYRGICIKRRGQLYDGGWACQLTLQFGIRGGLAVELIL
jgi:hypothetical protein